MWHKNGHVEDLQAVPTGSRLSIAAQSEGLAAGEALGVFRKRGGGGVGPVGDLRRVLAGRAGATALRSADDDEAAGLWILRGSVQRAEDPAAINRRRGVPSAGGRQRAGLSEALVKNFVSERFILRSRIVTERWR